MASFASWTPRVDHEVDHLGFASISQNQDRDGLITIRFEASESFSNGVIVFRE